MKIPKELKVGGHVYKVIHGYEDSQYVGQANHGKLQILLSAGERSKVEATFMHELLHCVDRIYCGGNLKEIDVERIGEGLYQVLTDAGMLK